MAAEIFDDEMEPTSHEAEVITELSEDEQAQTTEQITEQLQDSAVQNEEDELPEKYRGKSQREIIQMHQEAEKLLGKHSSEVGDLRKVVDTFIQGQTQSFVNTQQPTQVSEEEEEVDFFEDPQRAVTKAIDSHPAVQKAAQSAEEYRQRNALAKIEKQHPDMIEVMSNPKFKEWVDASSVRKQMLVHADQAFDADVASELLTLYKDRQSVTQQAEQAEQVTRQRQVKAASTGNANGSASASSGKRIYRRTDIIKLMKTDPDRYEALSPEIMQAYADGRVR